MKCKPEPCVYCLGVFGHCDDIDTGLMITEPGEYKVNLFSNGFRYNFVTDYLLFGDRIKIPGGSLNENTVVEMEIRKPCGGVYRMIDCETYEPTEYDYFRFEVVISITLNIQHNSCN